MIKVHSFFKHIWDTYVTLEQFIGLEEDSKSGKNIDFDPLNKYYFTNFTQLPQPTLSLNALINEIVNDMREIGEEAITAPKCWLLEDGIFIKSCHHHGLLRYIYC